MESPKIENNLLMRELCVSLSLIVIGLFVIGLFVEKIKPPIT